MPSTVVIIGGGIAGISCIESLVEQYNPTSPEYSNIILISENKLIKKATNFKSKDLPLETFDVVEDSLDILGLELPNGLTLKHEVGCVKQICSDTQVVVYKDSESGRDIQLAYDYVCICTGARPRLLDCKSSISDDLKERIVVIRDINGVSHLQDKLSTCRRLAIVGNGGISLELVHKISKCEKIWIIRDDFIGQTFFDSGAAKFLLDAILTKKNDPPRFEGIRTGTKFSSSKNGSRNYGPSLGPSWSDSLDLRGVIDESLEVVYNDEVDDIAASKDEHYPLSIVTKQGREFVCDLVALAIGVEPNPVEVVGGVIGKSLSDSGILIDAEMRTSLSRIYAAGDVVSCEKWPKNELWFQMRLWTQARQMGFYAGKCIASHLSGQDPSIYFNFECFTHCTTFFDFKLVLLGRYNAQDVDQERSKSFKIVARMNSSKDYVKILLNESDRIVGAVLVGDSGLEETIENLIHDRIDVGPFKDHLLDDTIDIEDYFD